MGYKRVIISLEENLVKDIDALIKAGFYRNRPELITEALLKIEPLKKLAEKRRSETFLKLLKDLEPMFRSTVEGDDKLRKSIGLSEG